MAHPLAYDPVEAARQRWIENGWDGPASGMAAVVAVMRAEQIFQTRASTILRPLGLTFARYQVLGMLRWTGPLTLGSVGHRLWITPGTVTSAVDRLEAAALCRRVSHPTDARATLVEITAKGRRLFDRAVEDLNADLFGTVELTEEERALLVRLIGKIRAAEGDVVNTEGNPVTDLRYDPYDVMINVDPYPAWRRLRDEAPLYFNEEHGFYALTRHADIERALVSWETFSSAKGAIIELIQAGIEYPPGILLFEDPPIHSVHLGLLSRAFTPRKMNALEPQIRALCAQSLDPHVGADGWDFIEHLGKQMPMKVIGMLLGIPEEDQAAIRDQADKNLRVAEGEKMHVGEDKLDIGGDSFDAYIEWRSQHPSDDLMTELLTAEFEDETGTVRTLTREEVLTYVAVVAGAGNETTTRLIGWAGKVLSDFPDQRKLLVEDPSLIPGAIEELLRFEPPAPHVARYVTQDVEYYGETVPAGSVMLMLMGSGNRDDRKFADGDSFQVHRDVKGHLSFGFGLHFCLGAALARLEGRVALEEVLLRFPEWTVDSANARLSPTSTVRGWETLPVSVP